MLTRPFEASRGRWLIYAASCTVAPGARAIESAISLSMSKNAGEVCFFRIRANVIGSWAVSERTVILTPLSSTTRVQYLYLP